MSWLMLSDIAAMAGGELIGADTAVQGVSTDSRNLREGDLFIALRGPRFDAHDFVPDLEAAVAAMVEHLCDTVLPQVLVEDTRLALGRLARAWRARLSATVVGLTGSNGKTTVKEMIAAILQECGSVHATRGNLNNDIGVPLTLLALRDTHDYAVIEMGANHAGEIAYLTAIAQPHVALITNAGPAHLEGFGSIEGVSRAKGEIFQGLPADGVAVINADDSYADYWRGLNTGRRILSFGAEQAADFTGSLAADGQLRMQTPEGELALDFALRGRHNLLNALCAAAAASAAGASLEAIRRGLAAMQPVSGRLQARVGRNGAALIDDSYNANPASMRAAIDVLAARPGRRVFVMGDMGELGGDATAMHAAIGEYARAAGIDRLHALGPLSAAAAEAFGASAEHHADWRALAQAVTDELSADVTVLVKGSRSMRMERVVAALEQQEPDMGKGHAV
ncbi:MAG: UDP-N-acetylmuramoyl-tripeptide--D-alanyl-D-alanine ligase [Gammaproteobacteria bacterium]|nr:UDP-N-acetylmuramoyl-tripeptide--D-alanyl-D-alanine ligase [Gammaproteobacteria bacterium]